MYRFYESPTTLERALALKAEYGDGARIIAGGTDLLIELERGRTAPDGEPLGIIDLTRVPGLAEIWRDGEMLHLGSLVTHNQCVVHPEMVAHAFPLARACWEIGAPQIRNRATVAGNIITASPANDSIVPLLALDATVTVQSTARGERTLALGEFSTGFRTVDMAADEILTRISFPALSSHQEGTFIKLGLRQSQAISVISVAVIVTWDADHSVITRAAISLGAVAPVIIRAETAEEFLVGKSLTGETIAEATALAEEAAQPINDVRGSAVYRKAMVRTLVARALNQIRTGQNRNGFPATPVLLWGESQGRTSFAGNDSLSSDTPATVNGKAVHLPGKMSLLSGLRAAGFVGVKEGCAEGECGACTVFLDGMAVMACMVPSERAAGSQVVTVEGLPNAGQLHPVQRALVESGGVQCGYCTPGFVMSAAKLLEERPQPTRAEAQEALTGNLCRCTGYRKILDAVVQAGSVAQ